MMHRFNLPICIINGAEGGEDIDHFLDTAPAGNYGNNFNRLKQRIAKTKLTTHIRSLIWFQGEQDAFHGMSGNQYLDRLNQLYTQYQSHFDSLRNIYVFQIRAGCTTPMNQIGAIQQAQLDFDEQHTFAHLFSTNYTAHDGCHFYCSGYRELARRLTRTLGFHDGYLPSNHRIKAPLPEEILFQGDSALILSFPVDAGIHQASEHFDADFFIPWYQWKPHRVTAVEGKCILSFPHKITEARNLTYTGHPGSALPAVYDTVGNAMLCFSERPIIYALPFNQQSAVYRNVLKNWKLVSPLSRVLQVKYSGAEEYYRLQILIIDSKGQIIQKYTENLQANMYLPVSALATGIYTLRILTQPNVIDLKFVKQ